MTGPAGDLELPVALISWRPRLTVRLRLTLSYAALVVVAGAVFAVLIYLVMRYVPNYPLTAANPRDGGYVASRGEILDVLVAISGRALLLLAIIGLWGGWVIAGRMLRPLQEITAAARLAAAGSLSHRIGLTGRRDEFTDLSDTFDTMLDRLQQSFQEYQRFAANASHELRTPQAIMKTMLEVALADPEGQDFGKLTQRLHETNQRGIDVVETLFGLSALSNRTVEKQAVDLALIARQALDALEPEAAAAGISLTSNLTACTVLGNDVLLRQLVMNLVQNGIRHNLATGTVSVSAHADPGDDCRVVLIVRNSGVLIPAEQVRTFVEPFVRGQGRLASTRNQRRGHGLGLALSSKFVEAHEGTLELSANPAGGLTATVYLPRAQL